ncbi:MAG: LemA family protein [Desulfobacterales bacterium]|nr:LemA family protein [Desulfobacterales bacterium]
MSKNVTTIIQRAYSKKYNLEPNEIASRPKYYINKLKPSFEVVRNRWVLYTSIILLHVIVIGAIYYFNLLIADEQGVIASRSKVQALMQRRHDLSINLSKAAYDYSLHEQNVFTGVVALRAMLLKQDVKDDPKIKELLNNVQAQNSVPQQPDNKALPLAPLPNFSATSLPDLSRLMAVAEQYPDLKLSATFQSLMVALIDVEKDLSQERIKYIEIVNKYTTDLNKFPNKIFAKIFKFSCSDRFEATEDAKKLKPIVY